MDAATALAAGSAPVLWGALPLYGRVLRYQCGPRERRVQGGKRRGVRAARGGTHS